MRLPVSLTKWILKLVLKLPESWLIKLSGKPRIRVGDRMMDVHTQFIASLMAKGKPVTEMTPAELREASGEGMALMQGDIQQGVDCRDISIQLKRRTLPARVYKPFGQDPNMPLIMYYHSGGGVIGDLETEHEFCALLSFLTKGPVVSVDYRLAPEHKWPAGLDDAIEAYEWGLHEADSFGAPPSQCAVAGNSMGANFSAIIAQEMMLDHKPQPVLQVLICPATDLESDTPSMHLHANSFPLTTDLMNWFRDKYLPSEIDAENPRISPLLCTQMEGLAPAIVITAGFDPLVDQGKAYADRLHDAGVDVTYRCFNSLPHGFVSFMGISPAIRDASKDIAILIRDQLRG